MRLKFYSTHLLNFTKDIKRSIADIIAIRAHLPNIIDL